VYDKSLKPRQSFSVTLYYGDEIKSRRIYILPLNGAYDREAGFVFRYVNFISGVIFTLTFNIQHWIVYTRGLNET